MDGFVPSKVNTGRIRDITLTLSDDGWSSVRTIPNITITILSSADGRDIDGVECVYNNKITTTFKVKEQVIDGIGNCINYNGLSDDVSCNLMDKLQSILSSLSVEEIDSMASIYVTLFGNVTVDINQRMIDAFVAEVAVYLVVMEMLNRNILWDFFPFRFDLPYAKIDDRILTYNMMKCMTIPFESAKIIGTVMAREISWMMISLFNSWATVFELGEGVDEGSMINKMVNNMAAAI